MPPGFRPGEGRRDLVALGRRGVELPRRPRDHDGPLRDVDRGVAVVQIIHRHTPSSWEHDLFQVVEDQVGRGDRAAQPPGVADNMDSPGLHRRQLRAADPRSCAHQTAELRRRIPVVAASHIVGYGR
jgi:hypothetical protein